MEKRFIVFIFAISAAFLAINLFFQSQNQETLKKWQEVQVSKKTQKIKQLETELSERAIRGSDLPLVEIFNDDTGTDLLNIGLADESSVITLAWHPEEPPQKVFVRKAGTQEPLKELYLTYAPQNKNNEGILLYRQGVPGKLLIADLPDFGKYDLILLFLHPENKTDPYFVTIADYIDGHFSLPIEQIFHLRKELHESMDGLSNQELGSALIIRKTAKGFLPVGLYQSNTHQATYFEDLEALSQIISKEESKRLPTITQGVQEKYFVLENDYQQLVFSNFGGALIEINLPFKTETNTQSVVRSIEFDREIVEKHPYNGRFPAHPFYTPSSNATGPFNEHIEGKLGGYYPLIRRDLIENRGRKSIKVPPRYYALNIISEYPEVAELVYEVKEFTKEKIVFETVQHHRKIKKTFSISKEEKGAPYCVDLTIQIEGDSRGLWLTSGIPEVEWISGSATPTLKYRVTRNNKVDVDTIKLPQDAETNTSIFPDWICNSNGFFGMIMNPITEIDPGFRSQYIPGTTVPSRLVEIDQEYEKYKAADLPGYLMLLPLSSKGGTMQFHIFAGPFADDILKQVDSFYSDPATGYNPDFIACQSFYGWFSFISEPFADFLFILMKFFHYLTNSWAFSIILLTVALRLMLYPLNAWSMNSMLKMQQIAPQVAAIQERYKKDPKKSQIEIMNLYREKGVNPMSGCLPLLIQMPFLIGMFDLLKSTFELRGASFIPGWIDNLAAPDVLFSWSTPIFFIGNQFHLLPFLLGGVMFLQQRMMSTLPKDPNLWTEQQRQQRTMGTMMTVVFTVMFYNFPSGLNIYWLSSMLLGILQQWWTQRSLQKK